MAGHVHTHTPVFTKTEMKQARRLRMVAVLVSVFFVAEFTGAVFARSNVLQADALHLLMDIAALAMSLLAMRIAVRRPSPRFTFGLRRAEPAAAIINGMLVLGATVEIVRRGIGSLRGHESPEAGVMLYVAVAALVVNGISAWLLHDVIGHAHHHHDDGHGHGHEEHGRGHSLNLKGARLHLLGDTLGSVAALIAALIIKLGGPIAADPIASFVVAFILLAGAARLIRDGMLVLLDAAPKHLDVFAIRRVLLSQPGVADIHDMHVWTLGAGHDAIVVHVRTDGTNPKLVTEVSKVLRDKFKVEYVTVQVDTEPCEAPPSLFADHEE